MLVCLEHSFWLNQQGLSLNYAFTKAWELYLKTQHAQVNQELDDYLRSKASNDWFTMKHGPSQQEHAEYSNIVLNNLLCQSSLCLL
jgi:hypothetical protein